jgi:hypothetical protein
MTSSAMPLKVLHIWDVSNVASIVARTMDMIYGTKSTVIVRKAFTFYDFPVYGKVIDSGPTIYAIRCMLEARKYDLIHVHNFDKIVPYLKLVYGKPVVLTYHSLTISKEWDKRRKRWSKADAVTVSTPNLLREGVTLIPNPVDTSLFKPMGPHEKGTAIYLSYNAEEEARAIAEKFGLKLTIVERNIKHADMPYILSKYEYFIDIKRSPKVSKEIIKAVSKTGLEALATGTKVITWDGRILESLPEENKPENVAGAYYTLYHTLI